MKRCSWAAEGTVCVEYHDKEWGVPSFGDRHLFEMLVLEGAQAGLSWTTILKKRAGYRRAFAGFDPKRVARFTDAKRERLLQDPSIVRNRLKVESAVSNAKALLSVQKEHGSFARFIWGFVGGKPIRNRRKSIKKIPAQTPESVQMSRELKRLGFRFVGPTICYAFMQAVGMVNDHEVGCFRLKELAGKASGR